MTVGTICCPLTLAASCCLLPSIQLSLRNFGPNCGQFRRQVDRVDKKKLSYRRVTTQCVLSVVILPIATQQCRNYLYDKSWPNWWYEVGGLVGGNASWTMCTQPWRDRVALIVSGVINKPTTVELCISPVYWRLAVAKFSKSTMEKLLTWPWPRPLRAHSLITRLRLPMADPCTKPEVSSVSRCTDITWGVKF